MNIAIGSDEDTVLTTAVIKLLKSQYKLKTFGALDPKCNDTSWPSVAMLVAESILHGESEQGIIFCWTGTGVSIAANKIPGIRAALCVDAEMAKGARKWNNANVLVMSLRYTSTFIAEEILYAWFNTDFSIREASILEKLDEIERKY
jgi:ribose 5-phosphate isomerase B